MSNRNAEIDKLVAKHVMGWNFVAINRIERGDEVIPGPFWESEDGKTKRQVAYWKPSEDIAAAWEVVEKLSHRDTKILKWGEGGGSWTWWVDFEDTNKSGDLRDRSISMAICLAALRACGVEVPE